MLHAEQLEALELNVNVPAPQAEQARSVVAEGVFETYVPAAQLFQALHADAPAPEKFPAAHDAQLAALVEPENVPATHDAQVRSSDEVGVFETDCPGAQVVHEAHAGALTPVEYSLAAQLEQVRSALLDPATATY